MKTAAFLMIPLLVTACANSANNGSQTPSKPVPPIQKLGGDQNATSIPQTLKVYEDNNIELNEIEAVNVNQGVTHFDFSYQPQQDEALTLTNVKSTLLGCQDSDVAPDFRIYQVRADGQIDQSAYDGLGPAPTLIKKDVRYVVRAKLTLSKSCQGVVYDFGIQVSH